MSRVVRVDAIEGFGFRCGICFFGVQVLDARFGGHLGLRFRVQGLEALGCRISWCRVL